MLIFDLVHLFALIPWVSWHSCAVPVRSKTINVSSWLSFAAVTR
uniref:Uncharacterized protein n=1 Tax=Arundo donax TaxID=35708 RepID=A0A0A9B7M5_ARUDO